ncbi:MAG TPA: TonB-dependent receptor [Bacteroidales bacterium]|nr:TonB-dependent receptor [Bacteroidales bacterium]
MKLTFFMVMVNILAATAAGYSQTAKVSLDLKNATLKEVLTEIEAQTDLSFIYKSDLVDAEQKVDIQTSDASIEQVLAYLFTERNIRCEILDQSLIVLLPNTNSAQQIKVTGVVTDGTTNEPLPGVNILIEGTSQGVITSVDGTFSIEVPAKTSVLLFSYIGYLSEKIEVAEQTVINVKLMPDVTNLQEVVVVGYGTTRKATATGAVTSTKGSEIQKSPSTNMTNNLIGRLPGVVSVTRSGEPGQDNSVLRVRGTNTIGNNDPLIVVDGISGRSMARLDPSDIESITVLKDASAAIYGAQAANGVILITTRRGQMGKPKITITVNGGFNRPTRIPEMADAATYAEMLNEIKYYDKPEDGRFQKYTQEDLDLFRNGKDPWGHPNTDWFGEVFKKNSNQNYENASISGGNENMKYFLSLGSRYLDGIYKHSATNNKQYDFRTNIDGKVSKHIDLGFDVSGRQENYNYPTRSAGDIFRMLQRGKPNMVGYWPSGEPGPDIEYGDNPVVTTTNATGYDKDKYYVLESNLRTNITLPWIKGLTITANAAFDKTIRFRKRFQTPWYLYTWNGNPDHILERGKRGLEAPQLTEEVRDQYTITWNAYATYETTFKDIHTLKAMVGTERQQGHGDYLYAFRKNFISAAIDQMFAGNIDKYLYNDGYADQNARLNYFGRVNYDLMQRYMLEFVWRYDGSNKFARGKQFGFFPAFSWGWRVSEESFWKNNISFINNFKLRGSWGQTGNDRIKEYMYLSTYILGSEFYDFNVNEQNKLLYEERVPNPDVMWEVATQTNIGFESLLFNKLSFEFDYFRNIRKNILWKSQASNLETSGFTPPDLNIGKVLNRGIDFIIGYRDRMGSFDYDISINGGYSKNEIQYWDEVPGRPAYQQSTGHPIPTDPNNYDSDLYYQAIGIYDTDAEAQADPAHFPNAMGGDIKFKDVNKDGVIDKLDMVRSDHNNMPRFIGGASINLRYKQFDASILIQGAAGAQLYISPESGEIGNYLKEFAVNRWTPENTGATYPRAWNRDEEYWRNRSNTFFLRKTDYIRLKNIEIAYNIPVKINQKLGIDGLRIYVNGMNLMTLDKLKVYDPELDNSAGTAYPLQKIVNAGVTLTF